MFFSLIFKFNKALIGLRRIGLGRRVKFNKVFLKFNLEEAKCLENHLEKLKKKSDKVGCTLLDIYFR